jgi:outer membrane receptor protein involved in Fe transport
LAVDLRNRYEEVAFFGNATAHLSDRLSIQAGARWSRNWQRSSEPLGGLLFGPLSGTVIKQKSTESVWTYALSPQFKITNNWNVYARVAKGFRPGGANLVLPLGGANPTYRSDTLINYEVGTKASALDSHLDVAVAAFWIHWRDIQTTAKDALGFNFLINGGKARSKGVEAEAHWHEGGLTLGANITYNDTKTLDAIPAAGALPGDRLPYSPRWAGAATADYRFGSIGDVRPSIGASIRRTGTQQAYFSQATAANPGNLKLPANTFLDLHAGLDWHNWQLSIFAENVTDRHAIVMVDTQFANPLNGQDARATIARPRTIGATLGVHF